MDECGICLDTIQNGLTLNCGHTFCRDCISPVLNKAKPKCNVCRCEITLLAPGVKGLEINRKLDEVCRFYFVWKTFKMEVITLNPSPIDNF